MKMAIRFPWMFVSLIAFILSAGGCGSNAGPEPEAEVQILNNSVYVWNRGTVDWSSGTVYLGRRSEDIRKTFGKVTPDGFAQLPLREFRRGTGPDSTPADVTDPETVWVVVEGFAPRRFEMDGSER